MLFDLKGEKCLKDADSIPTDDLIPQLGATEIITHWIFIPQLLEMTFSRTHSSLKNNSGLEPGLECPSRLDYSSAERAEDGVARFTTLVRARDY